MAPRKIKQPLRPWLLGTDEIPPPIDVPWQMWSKSSDPHQSGLILFEFTPEGIAVAWWGGEGHLEEKKVIAWHELAWLAGDRPRDLAVEIEWLKEQEVSAAVRDATGLLVGEAHRIASDFIESTKRMPQSPFTRGLVERCCDVLEKHKPKE